MAQMQNSNLNKVDIIFCILMHRSSLEKFFNELDSLFTFFCLTLKNNNSFLKYCFVNFTALTQNTFMLLVFSHFLHRS